MDPDSDFAKHLQEIHPDTAFTDQRGGIDFTVKDGKTTENVQFDFSPIEGKGNSITVNCCDAVNRMPLEGVQLSLIEAPNSYAKVIETWTTDETGTHTCTGLMRAGDQWDPPYIVRVDKVPEGYTGGYDAVASFGFVNNYNDEINYTFTQTEIKKEVSADVISFEDKSVHNDLAGYEVWRIYHQEPDHMDMEMIYKDIKPGEKISLTDGQYCAFYYGKDLKENGFSNISFTTLRGKQLKQFFEQSHFSGDSTMIEFTVKDGKPDRTLHFYIKNIDPEENDTLIDEETLAKYRKLWGDALLG